MKNCSVYISDDSAFEPEEQFQVYLGSPLGNHWSGARIGKMDVATITITNDEDGKQGSSMRMELFSPACEPLVLQTCRYSLKGAGLGSPRLLDAVHLQAVSWYANPGLFLHRCLSSTHH